MNIPNKTIAPFVWERSNVGYSSQTPEHYFGSVLPALDTPGTWSAQLTLPDGMIALANDLFKEPGLAQAWIENAIQADRAGQDIPGVCASNTPYIPHQRTYIPPSEPKERLRAGEHCLICGKWFSWGELHGIEDVGVGCDTCLALVHLASATFNQYGAIAHRGDLNQENLWHLEHAGYIYFSAGSYFLTDKGRGKA